MLKTFKKIVNFRQVLSVVISVQVAIAPYVSYAANTSSRLSITREQLYKLMINKQITDLATDNPVWEEFKKGLEQIDVTTSAFSANDPTLDQDPFFLSKKSQGWLKSGPSGSHNLEAFIDDVLTGFSHAVTEKGLMLKVPGGGQVMVLNQPLIPLHSTDRYLYFTARSSEMFASKTPDEEHMGEGLFFINRQEITAAAISGQAVPVYFFPLPGNGWTGKLTTSLEFKKLNVLSVLNAEGEPFSINEDHVAGVQDAERINLVLASSMRMMKSDWSERDFSPPPGSTAGFGIAFTGIDLSNPHRSLWQPASKYSFLKDKMDLFASGIKKFIGNIKLIDSAHADPFIDFLQQVMPNIPSKQVASIGWVLEVLSTLYIGGTLAKYRLQYLKNKISSIRAINIENDKIALAELMKNPKTEEAVIALYGKGSYEEAKKYLKMTPKKYLKEQEKEIKRLQSLIELSRTGKIVRELRETVSVLAEATKTTAKFAEITTANIILWSTDRFFPESVAGDHKIAKKILNTLVLWSRDALKNVPTNDKMFYLGALVGGVGVDTSLVWWQYFGLVPYTTSLYFDQLTPEAQETILKAYTPIDHPFQIAPTSPEAANFQYGDVIRNGVSWLRVGAAQYAMERKAQLSTRVQADVEKELRRIGFDPKDPKVKKMKEDLTERATNQILIISGIPGAHNFMFDAHTFFQIGTQKMGFKPTANAAKEDSFFLVERSGLKINVVRKMLRTAKIYHERFKSKESAEALEIAQQLLDDLTFLNKDVFRNALNGFFKTMRQANQIVTMLSYDGEIDLAIKYLPSTWLSKYNPKSAAIAGLFFRRSLYSFLTEDGNNLLHLTDEQMKKYRPAAEALVAKESNVANMSALEHEIEVEIKIHAMIKNDKQELAHLLYDPRSEDDATTTKQKSKAFEIAWASINNDKSRFTEAKWNHAYSRAAAKVVGLHINDTSDVRFLNQVDEAAAKTTKEELEKNKSLNHWIGNVSNDERVKLVGELYAANFLTHYKVMTTDRADVVDPLATDKPGRFQRFRQTKFLKNSTLGTRVVRLVESVFNDQTYMFGRAHQLERSIPGLYDYKNAIVRDSKNFPLFATAGYAFLVNFWGMSMSWPMWAIMIGLGSLTISPQSEWLTRIFRMQGIAPMGGAIDKIKFMVPFAMFTMGSMFLLGPISAVVDPWWEGAGRPAMMDVINSVPTNMYGAIGLAIPFLLSTRFRGLVGKMYNSVKQIFTGKESKTSEKPSEKSKPKELSGCDILFAN